MLPLWQAHLSFILALFVLLGSFNFTATWRPWLLPALALVSFLPVEGLSLAAYIRSYTDDLAITTLVLLGWAALRRLGLVQPLTLARRSQVLLVFAVCGLILYPATLGLTYFDPYRWGYNPRPMIVLIGLAALALLYLRNALGMCMLALATLAFALRLKVSENYWDYLIDPLLAGYCVLVGAKLLALSAWRRLRPAPVAATPSLNG
ncbi:hypothetical protein ACQKP5_18650 [Pseudomonas vancouverensis]|uniref:hypothetical protein n=1 Tax=Pseudomonas vancouverensis TaxID=95300 RepID=UPI003D06B9C6